jgi:hypothetical protein
MIPRTALVLALVCASSFAGSLALVEDPSLVVLDPGACLAARYRPWLGDNFGSGEPSGTRGSQELSFALLEEGFAPAVRAPGILASPLLTLAPARTPDRLVFVPLPPAAEAGLVLLLGLAVLDLVRRRRGSRKS